MLCRVLSLLCVGVSPGLVPVKVDVNQCVILFIILQQLLLTYQLKINKSFIHSFIIFSCHFRLIADLYGIFPIGSDKIAIIFRRIIGLP